MEVTVVVLSVALCVSDRGGCCISFDAGAIVEDEEGVVEVNIVVHQ